MQLHLVDRSRSYQGQARELMASVWYPAHDTWRYPPAPWMEAAPFRLLLESADFEPDAALAPFTTGHIGAPVRRTRERMPVVVFSHAAHDHRSENTVVVQELASHGYVVVTVDHTYDAFSEFPDGRVIAPVEDPVMLPPDFARDIKFIIDQLEVMAAGHNPDVDRRPLPAGLGAALDLRHIGMFGHSKGGTATALLMAEDRRVRAGLIMDGPMESAPPPLTDLDRPVMLMTAVFTRADAPPVAAFWEHLHGWRLNIQADGALHPSYSDYQVLIAQIAPIVGLSTEDLQSWIGTLDPGRSVKIQQAYPLAFFDLHLRHRNGYLLDGPSRTFPEVKFLP
ncbi:alpha/beta hydrolase family protein [Actinoplanes sp. NPDC051513]|uniref:alpha/beta hydrolase family protein n=1 Tax=Actinoplanes sp. NPDC051513 TaxID=3363908 RepID=UPI00379CBC9F